MAVKTFIFTKKHSTRYFIFISYKGTGYHGWQIQPGAISIQETLEKSLSLILGENISVTGAGRTDTGVHARFFCAHFDSMHEDLDLRDDLLFRINGILPKDISVNSIRKVTADAHARFSAISRTYEYHITGRKDPFLFDYAWFFHGKLDIEAMNAACRILFLHTDFTSFSKLHTDVKTNNCKIINAEWKQHADSLVFTIRADRFLRNMVRAIVGTMIETGRGKLSLEEFEGIILAKDRCSAGRSVPAKGLFLTAIEYPEDVFI